MENFDESELIRSSEFQENHDQATRKFLRREYARLVETTEEQSEKCDSMEAMLVEMTNILSQFANQLGQRQIEAESRQLAPSIEMPEFDGTNAYDWLSKVERFFSVRRYSDLDKLDLVAFSLEGDVLLWFDREMTRREFQSWDEFRRRLLLQFGAAPESSSGNVAEILEERAFHTETKGTMSTSVTEFEELSSQVIGLDESHLEQLFPNGLQTEMIEVLKLKESLGLENQKKSRCLKASMFNFKRKKKRIKRWFNTLGCRESWRKPKHERLLCNLCNLRAPRGLGQLILDDLKSHMRHKWKSKHKPPYLQGPLEFVVFALVIFYSNVAAVTSISQLIGLAQHGGEKSIWLLLYKTDRVIAAALGRQAVLDQITTGLETKKKMKVLKSWMFKYKPATPSSMLPLYVNQRGASDIQDNDKEMVAEPVTHAVLNLVTNAARFGLVSVLIWLTVLRVLWLLGTLFWSTSFKKQKFGKNWWYKFKHSLWQRENANGGPQLLKFDPGSTEKGDLKVQLRERDLVLLQIQHNLQKAQDIMTKNDDKKRHMVEFAVDDWVYLNFLPSRQLSVIPRNNQKLAAKFFGPFQVVERIGAVAFRLKLPPGSKIHAVFHVSQLKAVRGVHHQVQSSVLPELLEETVWIPEAVLDIRFDEVGRRELLVKWQDHDASETSWMFSKDFVQLYPSFKLEDKLIFGKGSIDTTHQTHYRKKKKGFGLRDVDDVAVA